MCFENAGHFFLSSVNAALVYSRIYIAVRYSRLGVNPDQKEGFDPCRERGEQCETTPRSVELLRFWRRRPCSSGPPPYCPVPPRNHLPHFQLGEIQIQLNYSTIYLATIIIIDCWKSPPHTVESFRGPFICVRLLLWFFMHIKFLSHNLVERNFNRFRSVLWFFLQKNNTRRFQGSYCDKDGRFVAWYY